MICKVHIIMSSRSSCFSCDEKSSYSKEERLQLAELLEQFNKEHLKEKETLEGKTRYGKNHKMHIPVVTYGNFVAKTVRKFYFNLSDKPNDDPQICSAHSLAIRSFTNIDKLWDPSICPPKKNMCHRHRKKGKGP